MHTKNLDFGYAVQSTSCAVEDGLFKYISKFVLSIPIRYLRLLHPFVVLWCCLFFCVVTQEWGERSTALACELCDVYVDTCSLSLLFISKFRVVHPHQVKRLSSDSFFLVDTSQYHHAQSCTMVAGHTLPVVSRVHPHVIEPGRRSITAEGQRGHHSPTIRRTLTWKGELK